MPFPTRSQRRCSPRLRYRVVAGLAGAIATTCFMAAPADAAVPARVNGDHHSPTVAARAAEALAAQNMFAVTRTPGDFVTYVAGRNATADAVAAEMALDPVVLRDAWARPDLQHQKALLAALTQLGVAYRGYMSTAGVGFDCSGLTSWAWAQAGVQIAHQSGAQISAAARRDSASAVAGDLMQYPGHVMMYLGVGQAIVHASNPSTDVELGFTDRSVRWGDPTG